MTPFRFISSFVLLLLTFILVARSYTARSVSLPPAAYCGYPDSPASPLMSDTIQLQLWAVAYGPYCGRAFGPVAAARRLNQPQVAVVAKPFITLSDTYRNSFLQAAQVGAAPDIAVANVDTLVSWSEKGYIVPFDSCRKRYPEFTDVIDPLWATQKWKNQAWGVPFNLQLHILYFNKTKLQALGWSEQHINQLPEQIKTGQFTLVDMLNTAKQAIDSGVIEPGFGYWPHLYKIHMLQLIYIAYGGHLYDQYQQKRVITQEALAQSYTLQRQLLTDKLMSTAFIGNDGDVWQNNTVWNDAVMQGRVLFWTGQTSDWAEWTINYVRDLGGIAYQSRTIGYALFPSSFAGVPGHALWAGANYYVIVGQKASGRTLQMAACSVLAQTITPEINGRFGIRSREHTVLKSETHQPTFTIDHFNIETAYMWNYAVADHGRNATLLAATPYISVLVEFMEKVERGELSPTVAAANAVQHLHETLGDALIIE